MEPNQTPTAQAAVSAVVVTYRRPEELRRCLESLSQQTRRLDEVVVVDNDGTGDFDLEEIAGQLGFDVEYVRSPMNSLTVARNLGVARSRGRYVLLVDDDVELAPDFVAKLGEVLDSDTSVVGAQGFIAQGSRSLGHQLFGRLFRLYHHTSGEARVMRSISTTYPRRATGLHVCQWLSGSNQFYRREVLETIRWDENFIMYCDGEDLDHSYRVSLAYPSGLRLVGAAGVGHSESAMGRLPSAEFVLMREAYGLYLSHKLFPRSAGARAVFIWSRVGIALETTLRAVRRRSTVELRAFVHALGHVWTNRSHIRNGSLDATNELLRKRC